MNVTIEPDPNDPEAVKVAADLVARMNTVRVGPGEAFTVRPGRFSRRTVGYAVFRVTEAERIWLNDYQRRVAEKRRADNEAARRDRRARMRGEE